MIVSTDLAVQWATKINRSMADSVTAFLATGRALSDAKKQLKHGGFQRLFAGHPQAVTDPVRCSPRTARVFMQLAEHPILSNRKHVTDLPPNWGTLWALARLPETTLEKALTDGRVHPGMERRDVATLLGRPKQTATEPTKPLLPWMGSPVGRCYSEIAAKLEGVALDLSPDDRAELFVLIRGLLDDLDRRGKEHPA